MFVHAVRLLELAGDLAVRTSQRSGTCPGRWGRRTAGSCLGPVRKWRRGRSGACGSSWWRRGRTAVIELRGVEGDVVVDELANEGEPGREAWVGVFVGGVVVVFLEWYCRSWRWAAPPWSHPGCRAASSDQAGSGGWLLNMKPKRPSVVGLWVTRSMPRNSAPWGGVGGSSAAAAGAIQAALTAVPSEVAPTAVPSETAAVPFRKLRRLKSSARFSPIAFPPISSRPGGAKRGDHVCPDKALYVAGWILSTREL